MANIITRFKTAWNVFMNRSPTDNMGSGPVYSYRPDRVALRPGSEQSIVNSVYSRMAVDAASIPIKHVRTDELGRYIEDIDSGLNNILTLEANSDQTSKMLIQDIVLTMLEEGAACVVPTRYKTNSSGERSEYLEFRVGKIIEWSPLKVRVQLYNDISGNKEELIVNKADVAIIENPYYSIMNSPNSIGLRLKRKLALLDSTDEKNNSGKIDMLVQVPYAVKTDSRREYANRRLGDLENQLNGSKYGIGYIDATEKVIQLNRPIENNLLNQVKYFTEMFLSQLSFNQTILDGTADEKVLSNYTNRVILPIVSVIVDEFKRKFLTKTARTQGQTIMYFNDIFRFMPLDKLAEVGDKFTRNAIVNSNEIRQIIGLPPSSDPEADTLRNKNLNLVDNIDPNADYSQYDQEESFDDQSYQ